VDALLGGNELKIVAEVGEGEERQAGGAKRI
jgi:hypothetical protein